MKVNAVKTVITWLVLSTLLLSCLGSVAYADPVSTITGIIDYNGNPAPGAVVTASSGETTTSLADGSYTLSFDVVPTDPSITVSVTYISPNGFHYDYPGQPGTVPESGPGTGPNFDYTVPPVTVNGVVTCNGATITTPVTVTISGSSVQSDSSGAFTISGVTGDTQVTINADYIDVFGITHSGQTSIITSGDGSPKTGANINIIYAPPVSASGSVTYNGGTINGNGPSVTATSGTLSFTATATDGSFIFPSLPGDSDITFTTSYLGHVASILRHSSADGSPVNGLTIDVTSPATIVGFQSSGSSITEGDSVTLTLVRSGDNPNDFDVSYSISGSGYGSPSPASTVHFSAGQATSTITTTIPVTYSSRTINFTLDSATSGAVISSGSKEYRLDVVSAGASPTIGFTVAGTTVGASGGDVSVSVHRYGSTAEAVSAVVTVIGASTAVSGTDYTTNQTMPWTVNFAAGETEKMLAVHVNGGSGGKNVVFQLGSFSGATAALNAQYTLSIQAAGTTGGSGGSFQFQTANANAASGDVVVNVLRAGINLGTSSVEVWVSGASTAVSGTDFTVRPYAPITLTFGPGETTKQLTVNILGNHPGTASKNIVLMLVNPSGGASLSAPETYTLALGDKPAVTSAPSPTSIVLSATPPPGAVTTWPTPSSRPPAATQAPTTVATKPNWSWVVLLGFIPLTGFVMYFFAFVKDR